MSLLTRIRRSGSETPVAPSPAQPDSTVVMRFATLGGAAVVVSDETSRGGHWWTCEGCLDSRYPALPSDRGTIRDDANQHASTCRAMPQEDISKDPYDT